MKFLKIFFILFLLFFRPISFAESNQDKLKSLQIEIDGITRNQSIGPKKTYITPNTREVGYAMYYEMVKKKIEQIGTRDFPILDGQRLYGKLIVRIPIFQDGSIFEKDGGPRVEKTSGNEQLDEIALKIVHHSAPFDAIPNNLRSKDRDDILVVITVFNFTDGKTVVDSESKKQIEN